MPTPGAGRRFSSVGILFWMRWLSVITIHNDLFRQSKGPIPVYMYELFCENKEPIFCNDKPG